MSLYSFLLALQNLLLVENRGNFDAGSDSCAVMMSHQSEYRGEEARQTKQSTNPRSPALVGSFSWTTGIVPQVSERTVAGVRLALSIRAEDADAWTLEAFGPSVHLCASHFFAL